MANKANPVTYTCTCPARSVGGSVLLFYRYWTAAPPLSPEYNEKAANPEDLATWHKTLMHENHLTGKVRIAKEGYNITVGGTKPDIQNYITACRTHWSFDGLQLDSDDATFFKPSPGCACVFDSASVRVTAEITPMGIEGYIPQQWETVRDLSPAEFHAKCHEKIDSLLIDVRNHYESRIGYFISPVTGEPAIRPPIRRFSQWPHYISRHIESLAPTNANAGPPKQILTYCTGGIRCEKAVRWMQENVVPSKETEVFTLKGGIAAYLTWMDEEIRMGRKTFKDSLFQGRNFVFDGRGSTALDSASNPVANCHGCGVAADGMGKCASRSCNLILIVCPQCEGDATARCCEDCKVHDMEETGTEDQAGGYTCQCEKDRERQLWRGEKTKLSTKKRQTSAKKGKKAITTE